MKKTLIVVVALLLSASLGYAATVTATGTTTLSLTVSNEANIAVTTSTTTLSSGNTTFSDYTGTTNYKYQIRTSSGGTGGSVTLKVTADFSDGSLGKPSVGSPPTGGDLLTFTCTAAVGTACASAQTASTTVDATAITFGINAHAGAPGNVSANGANGSVVWNFTNDPIYPTGPYSATVTFTISAT